MDGARWVHETVLKRREDFRLYAVWIPMLKEDKRGCIDPALFADPRALRFWDGRRVLGRWFAETEDRLARVAWDSFFLYGPEARWRLKPSPLLRSGFPVLHFKSDLNEALRPLLRGKGNRQA